MCQSIEITNLVARNCVNLSMCQRIKTKYIREDFIEVFTDQYFVITHFILLKMYNKYWKLCTSNKAVDSHNTSLRFSFWEFPHEAFACSFNCFYGESNWIIGTSFRKCRLDNRLSAALGIN